MLLTQNQSLQNYNTFGIKVSAAKYASFETEHELIELLNECKHPLILGGGSNVLFTQNFEGTVLKNDIKGKSIIKETDNHVFISFGAGENWHECVLHALENNWGGIENLSLIPGTIGAAPMQNIGAYGIEIKSIFDSLTAVEIGTGKTRKFNAQDCKFGYRESVFKNELKDKYVITHVVLQLSKNNHDINTSYGAVNDKLLEKNITEPTIQDVSNAVIAIRQSKLPDPEVIGNAGSFFKNPTISKLEYDSLKHEYPEIPGYPVSEDLVKVPAGWLIEKCGWKGERRGEIGVHEKQALVLVNYGEGRGTAIYQLAQDIQTSVKERFGIRLNTEVNII